MATKKKTAQQTTKERMKKDLNKIEGTADLVSGQATPSGKLFKDPKKLKDKTKTTLVDIDKYLLEVEKGFTDLTPEKNDYPYNNSLGKVRIERLTKGTGKHKQ